jgi:tetratricopeptide (TPR) repeat protein
LCKIVRGDLDWIVLKALEKDRTRRYETANGLARDIERHLSDEPVVAGPPRVGYKLRKFVRRNRTSMVAGSLVAGALLIGFCLALFGFVQASRERSRAEKNFQMARDVVDEITQLVEKQLADTPEMSQVRKKLLQKAQLYYEDFLEENSNDPAVREETIGAYFQLSDIYRFAGEKDQAKQVYDKAIVLLEELVEEFPTVAKYRGELAEHLFLLGILLKNQFGDKEEALKMYRRSFELRAELVEEFPNEPAYISDLAWSHVDLGLVLSDLGRYQEAIPELRRALSMRKQLVAEFPDNEEHVDALAHSHHWLGSRLYDIDQLKEAEQHLRKSLSLRKGLLVEEGWGSRHELVHIQISLGNLLINTGQIEEAVRILSEAATTTEKLAAEFPRNFFCRQRESIVYTLLGEALFAAGLLDKAEDAMRKGLAVNEYLVADFPEISDFQSNLAKCFYQLGNMLSDTGRLEEALQAYRQAIEIREKLTVDFPDVPQYRGYLAQFLKDFGRLLEDSGRLEEAEQAYQKAEEIEKEMDAEETEDSEE